MISAVQLTNLRSQCGAPWNQASPRARRPRRIATILTMHQTCPANRKEAGSLVRRQAARIFHRADIWSTIQLTDGSGRRREHAGPARRCSETEGVAVDLRLDGKVAVVTGASKGIGRCVASFLAREGCDVVITARTAAPLEAAAEKIAADTGRAVLPLAGDMSVTEDVQRCVDATLEQFGQIDILVTCAGSSPGGLLEDLTEEQWMSSLNLKFMGYVRSVRAVIGHMRERGEGAIVLVVGNDGLKPSYWEMTAGVANAADINFASSVAEQYGRHGVRINTVNPGPVNTDRWDTLEKAFARDKGVTQERAHELAEQSIPVGRICEPDEVAALVTFLASPLASFINGAHIPVDGAQRKAMMDQ
jgi:3-oxoacyl-[acyl-carrier protein] reductase